MMSFMFAGATHEHDPPLCQACGRTLHYVCTCTEDDKRQGIPCGCIIDLCESCFQEYADYQG